MSYIKLQTNVPVYGRIKYADFAKSEYQGQETLKIKLKGTWEGHPGDQDVYIKQYYAQPLFSLGLIQEAGDKNGIPQYRVISPARIKIVQLEEGTKKPIQITMAEGNSNGAPMNLAVPPAPAGPIQPGRLFAQLKETMQKCIDFALQAWPPDTGKEVIGATAHSLFIECNKRNILAPVPEPPAPLANAGHEEIINGLVIKLGWGHEHLQEALNICLIKKASQMLETEAHRLIKYLEEQVSKAEEAARQKAAEPPPDEPPW